MEREYNLGLTIEKHVIFDIYNGPDVPPKQMMSGLILTMGTMYIITVTHYSLLMGQSYSIYSEINEKNVRYQTWIPCMHVHAQKSPCFHSDIIV